MLIGRRKFLRTSSGLIIGFPAIIRAQFVGQPGVGALAAPELASSANNDTSVVTGQTLGTLRNNFTGTVGFIFNATAITVTALGRWVLSGNSGSHTVTLYDEATTSTVISVSVNTSGATAGQFLYVNCTPTLLVNTRQYALETAETSGGDQWYDGDSSITYTAAITNVSRAANHNASGGSANQTYGPVSFKYH